MNPSQFIAKWRKTTLSESSAAQQHFLDLCDLLGHPKPADVDASGEDFAFERGAAKHGGGDGWADVWKRGFFGWEYKGKHKDLNKAYDQLLLYRAALENPPLLVVSDMDRIVIHTNFTATATETFTIPLEELGDPYNLEILRYLFFEPHQLRPVVTSPVITEKAARHFGELAQHLRARGEDPLRIAPFLDRLIFCLFVEDIYILPVRLGADSSPPLLTHLLRNFRNKPQIFTTQLQQLFATMATGGYFGADPVLHFNGDLFREPNALTLTTEELNSLYKAAKLDWSKVEPAIFGTLFERGLDPEKRSQLGAHYTSREDIETLVEPVLMAPLRREWRTLATDIETAIATLPDIPPPSAPAKTKASVTREHNRTRKAFTLRVSAFMRKLRATTVLDPACGSGNFLYVALRKLKDLERDTIEFCLQHDIHADALPLVGPHQMFGIEINTYAYHLAQLVVWIGHLQWMHAYGYGITEPVLQPLKNNFQNKDAILDLTDPDHPKKPTWPKVDVIIGNPPFLGGKLLRRELGDENVDNLFAAWDGRLPRDADLCCYWFEQARLSVVSQRCTRAGLLATQGIRGGANRDVLNGIKASGDIFFAESDRPWVLDGAHVHVSMVGFDDGSDKHRILDQEEVARIHSNLTATTCNVTLAKRLLANRSIAFQGPVRVGPFNVTHDDAESLLQLPNPHGRPNSDVLRLSVNGSDLTRRSRDQWAIDFATMELSNASLYEEPFRQIKEHVYPKRLKARDRQRRERWWLHGRSGEDIRDKVFCLGRYVAMAQTAKYLAYQWLTSPTSPEQTLIVFARSDDYFFGILHSRLHEVWALKLGTRLETRPRYTPTSCFETFPFPWPPGEEPTDDPRVIAIGEAAAELNEKRENWLNPREWVQEEILEFPGSIDGPWSRYLHDPDDRGIGTVRYPRLVPKDPACAGKLKKRTLTNLYNDRPTWLDLAHRTLDQAVATAYNLPPDLTDEQILEELLTRNLHLASQPSNDTP